MPAKKSSASFLKPKTIASKAMLAVIVTLVVALGVYVVYQSFAGGWYPPGYSTLKATYLYNDPGIKHDAGKSFGNPGPVGSSGKSNVAYAGTPVSGWESIFVKPGDTPSRAWYGPNRVLARSSAKSANGFDGYKACFWYTAVSVPSFDIAGTLVKFYVNQDDNGSGPHLGEGFGYFRKPIGNIWTTDYQPVCIPFEVKAKNNNNDSHRISYEAMVYAGKIRINRVDIYQKD